jgi:hypothetical protein
MAPTKEADQVLKADAAGRVRTPLARREQLLDEFERSGTSGVKFAALVGIKYPTFASWVLARRRKGGSSPVPSSGKPAASPMRFLEAVVPSGEPVVLEVELPGGARLLINDPRQAPLAAALIRSLNARTAC